MFALDGKPSNFSDNDKARRNTIVGLLSDWGLLNIIDENYQYVPENLEKYSNQELIEN